MQEVRVQNRGSETSPMSVALAWAVVVLPAAWGIYNTALRAAKLFH